jgi:Ca2+:H+ antiporter
MALNLQGHSYCIAHGPRARGFERRRTFSKDLQRPYIADSSESTIGKGASTKSISGPNNIQGVKDIFISPLSILLLAFPVLIMAHVQKWGDGPVFWLAFTAMIPLAKILGDTTEELAMNLNNDMLSGLLNATFGNAVELIMVIAFLRTHEYMIVKFTCIGSVLSNMLLVLGMSFFAGGLVATPPSKRELEEPLLEATIAATIMNKQQKYSSMGAMVNTTLLLLSCLGLSLVTVKSCRQRRPG